MYNHEFDFHRGSDRKSSFLLLTRIVRTSLVARLLLGRLHSTVLRIHIRNRLMPNRRADKFGRYEITRCRTSGWCCSWRPCVASNLNCQTVDWFRRVGHRHTKLCICIILCIDYSIGDGTVPVPLYHSHTSQTHRMTIQVLHLACLQT